MPFRLTSTLKILLAANLFVFILQHTVDRFLGGNFSGIFGLVPARVVLDGHLWQIFTYSFLHGDVTHLFLNLLMLVFIGGEIEGLWGRNRFLKYYFFCTSAAAFAYLLMQVLFVHTLERPMIGASGGIFGLLVAYGIFFSERQLLFMLVFPMKAKHFVLILGGIELMTLLFSPGGGLSSLAHLTGMVAGISYLWVAARFSKMGGWAGFQGRRRKSKLKLVVNNDSESQSAPPGAPEPPNKKGGKTWH